jgi:hypothetical protein
MGTYKRLSHTRTAVKQKYLSFSFILDEISPPGLGTFLTTRIREFLDESSYHLLPGFGHNKAVDGSLVDLWLKATCIV